MIVQTVLRALALLLVLPVSAQAQIVIDVPGRADVPLAVARTASPQAGQAQALELWQGRCQRALRHPQKVEKRGWPTVQE